MNLVKMGRIALDVVKKNSPFILSAVAGVGLIALYALTIKETEEAKDILDEEEESFEKTKKIIKIYAPSFLCLMITLVCIVSSAVISHHMIRDLTLYAASVTAAYNKYRQHNIDQNGVDSDQRIIADIARESVLDEPPKDDEGILCLMNGYDHFFRVPNIINVYAAILELNEEMNEGPYERAMMKDFWEKAKVMDPLDHKYLGHGWSVYDLNYDHNVSALYPGEIYKETDDSGLEWYMIDIPAAKPLGMII